VSSRLLILACSQTKRPGPEPMRAIERYNGPLWQTLRAADPLKHNVGVAFVSARYGFSSAWREIDDYNLRLTPELAEQMLTNGIMNQWPTPIAGEWNSFAIPQLCSANLKSSPIDDIALVGGHLYVSVMRGFVEQFQAQTKYVKRDARIVEINDCIGYMRQSLTSWINGAPRKQTSQLELFETEAMNFVAEAA